MHLGAVRRAIFLSSFLFLFTLTNASAVSVDCNEGDLTAAIQKASSDGGGTVTFNCSNTTILMSSGLGEIQSNVTLDGENRNITIEYAGSFSGCVPGDNGIGGPAILRLRGNNNIVRNLTFKHFLESLQINGANNIVENNVFLAHNCSDDGLSSTISTALNFTVRNNWLQDYNDKAFQMSYGSGLIEKNTFLNCAQPIRGAYDNFAAGLITIRKNDFNSVGVPGECDGVRITGSYNILFEGNIHSNCKRGLRIGETVEIEIKNNLFDSNQRTAIRLYDNAKASISGNLITRNGTVPGTEAEGGVVIENSAQGDFGGGSILINGATISSAGLNTFTGNGFADVRNERSGYIVKAESNCWGSTDPNVFTGTLSGSVDADPFLVDCSMAPVPNPEDPEVGADPVTEVPPSQSNSSDPNDVIDSNIDSTNAENSESKVSGGGCGRIFSNFPAYFLLLILQFVRVRRKESIG